MDDQNMDGGVMPEETPAMPAEMAEMPAEAAEMPAATEGNEDEAAA